MASSPAGGTAWLPRFLRGPHASNVVLAGLLLAVSVQRLEAKWEAEAALADLRAAADRAEGRAAERAEALARVKGLVEAGGWGLRRRLLEELRGFQAGDGPAAPVANPGVAQLMAPGGVGVPDTSAAPRLMI